MNYLDFKNRKALLVTKHQKEKVIAPLLHNAFGISLDSSKNIDTDSLGTFTGEVQRIGVPQEAAKNKIALAFDLYDHEIIIASEGSFFPNPQFPLSTMNHELILLYDRKNDVFVDGQFYTSNCTYFKNDFTDQDVALKFCLENDFPKYGVILSVIDFSKNWLIDKEVDSKESFLKSFKHLKDHSKNGVVKVECDLRAHRNPQRMLNIEKAALNLVANMNSFCPQCNKPGFAIRKRNKGLPCGDCGFPTNEIKENVFICQCCQYENIENLSSIKSGNPMYCDRCNP